jgi:hypothetical protein
MTERSAGAAQRALRVLAKSVFKELKGAGYSRAEMVTFASELLDLVTDEIKAQGSDDGAGEPQS